MENIRNDHIYIQLMKQHMTKNEHITRYLRKPIFLENHNSNFCIFAPEGPREKNCTAKCSQWPHQGAGKRPRQCCHPKGGNGGRGPEGPEDKRHGHSRARRAREWPKHASPRARRARGRAKLSARLGACQCYYMFFTTQLKIAKFIGRFQDLNVGQKS